MEVEPRGEARPPTAERGDPLGGTCDAVYLSPHIDDAVLSCGGTIRRRSRRGQRILVVTVCAGVPEDGGALSPYAERLHRRWGSAAGSASLSAVQAVQRRLGEDRAALSRLGATGVWLDVPDAIYRRDPATGRWPYDRTAALFRRVHRSDGSVAADLAARLAELPALAAATEVIVPLSVGHHVDHQLVRTAAELWRDPADLRYYEDYPYAEDDAAVATALARPQGWRSARQRLAVTDMTAKVEAVACYASQMSTFWPDLEAMRTAVCAFSRRQGGGRPAERTWRRRAPPRARRMSAPG